MLQLLGALDRPAAGEVLFEDNSLERMGDGELARLRRTTIGFIFQQFNLIPTLTARQNVEVALAPAGLAERASAGGGPTSCSREVGLAARADHLPSQLSGGEQQRVAIARALANEPRVLLADEPTGNLDTATGEEVMESVERLWREQGLTVVLVTHDRAIAERAPRVIEMRDGVDRQERGRTAAGLALGRSGVRTTARAGGVAHEQALVALLAGTPAASIRSRTRASSS